MAHALAAADYLSRASTRRTCGASHVPRPVAVGTPRVLRALAMPCSDVTPAACISATMGATSVALAMARALRASRPAIRAVAVRLPDCRSGSTGCSWLRLPPIALPSADDASTSLGPPCSGPSRRGLETTERAARLKRLPTLTAACCTAGQSGPLDFVPIQSAVRAIMITPGSGTSRPRPSLFGSASSA
jgi:hypothetical protein